MTTLHDAGSMAEPDYVARQTALRELMGSADLEVLYVSQLTNIRYLTGFTGSNAGLLIGLDGCTILITDSRYQDQAQAESPTAELVISRDILGIVKDRAAGRFAAETHHLTADAWVFLDQPESSTDLVEQLRVVKDRYELEQLRTACEISSVALAELWTESLIGRSEQEVAHRLYQLMIEAGADGKAFETIVASGPNSAIPHHRPTSRRLTAGDFLKIDFGALVRGYHADCTRTVVLGTATSWQREIYGAVQEAQAAGLDALRPGRLQREAQQTVRENLERSGYLDAFTTGLGHGVGLQIHEDPFLTLTGDATLASRTALTMEPGIYLPGRGGVRIEDTVVVADEPDGTPEVLTTLTKDLLEID